jgi:hypothetical protein
MVKKIMIMFACLALWACAEQSTKPAAMSPEFARVAAVSVSRQGFALQPGDNLAWRRDVIWLDSGAAPVPEHIARVRLKSALETQLRRQGLRLVHPDQADYHIVAAMVVGDSPAGESMKELAQLYPSLEPVSEQLPSGTLLFAVSYSGSRTVLWRSAVQLMILEDLTVQQRQQRLEIGLQSLFRELPVRVQP